MKKAQELLAEILNSDERVLDDPAPTVAVAELADSSVNLVVRPWVKKEDYWPLKFDLNERIKDVFDENDIEGLRDNARNSEEIPYYLTNELHFYIPSLLPCYPNERL